MEFHSPGSESIRFFTLQRLLATKMPTIKTSLIIIPIFENEQGFSPVEDEARGMMNDDNVFFCCCQVPLFFKKKMFLSND
jgi:hypothetical protein